MKTHYWMASIALLAGLVACDPQPPSAPAGAETAASARPAEIDVAQLKTDLDGGKVPVLVDVRSPAEFESGHIASAVNIPVDQLESRLEELQRYKEGQVYLICRSGRRSAAAADLLTGRGFHAINVQGGMQAWQKAGY